ncbi:MAG: hypothetical protein HYW33_00215 [Candidatus Blackburnbacteria bacterium]|nr:hypothetical protein [Candidatus Blackburnbacteria bacterium]
MVTKLLFIVVFALAGFLAFRFFSQKPNEAPIPSVNESQTDRIFVEKIPGSKFHSPDATWWGYNQSKIVRFKDLVFMYVIENLDDSNKTSSDFVVYIKDGNKPWQKGAAFPTSRPGNILIDSKGVLHAFVFEPFVETNDSIGRIMHYYFPNSASGDVKNYEQEVVVDNDGRSETANIRVGAAIGDDDTMVISFGLTKFNPLYKEQSEHIYFKKPSEKKWNHTFTDGLVHDFFYPFTLISENTFYLLPIQDDFTGEGNPNIYQKILLLEIKDGVWKKEIIADLTSHPLAQKRYRLLEQSDFFEDSFGKIHIIYKESLDPSTQWKVTGFKHLTKTGDKWDTKEINQEDKNLGWIRIIEVDSKLYYLGTSWNKVFLKRADSSKWVELDTPTDVKAIYPYVATKKGGTQKGGNYVDVLLLGADQKEYATTSHYYLKIPKKQFRTLQ